MNSSINTILNTAMIMTEERNQPIDTIFTLCKYIEKNMQNKGANRISQDENANQYSISSDFIQKILASIDIKKEIAEALTINEYKTEEKLTELLIKATKIKQEFEIALAKVLAPPKRRYFAIYNLKFLQK